MLEFKIIKWQFMMIGVTPFPKDKLPSILKNHQLLINWIHITVMFVSIVLYFLAPMHFLLFKATNFSEYTESTFYSTVTTLHFAIYTIQICKRSVLIALIRDLEEIIDKSIANFIFFIKNLAVLLLNWRISRCWLRWFLASWSMFTGGIVEYAWEYV